MIRTSKCQDNFYIVTCADIECAVLASSFEEAASNGLKNIINKTPKKVNNKICMTGEVDLQGESGIIGGLESKLPGGKKAGCTLALIPKDNMEDLERMRREGLSPEDDNFKVLPVTHIKEILLYALV